MLSDVQYRELIKCYADPVKMIGEHAWGGCELLRPIFVEYVTIKDIVSSSLVNRAWKQMLSNDPNILFKLCVRSIDLNSGFKLQPAFFSDNVRNNSDTMLNFIKTKKNYIPTMNDSQFIFHNLNWGIKMTFFDSIEFLGDQLEKNFFFEAVKILGFDNLSRMQRTGPDILSKIPKGHFDDPDFEAFARVNFINKWEI